MIGFGTKSNTSQQVIQKAAEVGYRMFDTKDSNESIPFFKILPTIMEDRNRWILCSKLMGENSPENHHPENVISSCKASLERAGLEYWDIYYIHTTHSFNNVPILDTYREMLKLQNLGLIKKVGLSNITYEQLEAIIVNTIKPDYVQIEIHPFLVEDRMVQFCIQNGIQVVAHSPLGSSLWHEINKEKDLIELANKYQKTVAQIILKWHVFRGILPIPSSNRVENMVSNMETDFFMETEDLLKITRMNQNKRVYVKPNHYESIGPVCIPFPKRKMIDEDIMEMHHMPQNETNKSIHMVNEIVKNGFYLCDTNIDENIHEICIKIHDYLCENKERIQFQQSDKKNHRFYEFDYEDANLDEWKKQLLNHPLLCKISHEYLKTKYHSNGSIKTTYPTPNLRPYQTGLYHRDNQKQKCLKIIIYLSEVGKYNGPLKLVLDNGGKNTETIGKIIWYLEKKIPRTTEEQIIQSMGNENILRMEGGKYTMIFLEGSLTHSGGYVQQGFRDSIYIEMIPFLDAQNLCL